MIATFRKQYPEYADMPDNELMQSIHARHYSDMSPEEFASKVQVRPNHDDLETAAVRGADSLQLQELAPGLKPMVKMTVKELAKLQDRIGAKIAVIANGAAYIIDPQAIDPLQAFSAILSGDESEALGYPAPGPNDAAVTKQGDIITDLPAMKRHAETGNVMWAASGNKDELQAKAVQVADAIKQKGVTNGKGTDETTQKGR